MKYSSIESYRSSLNSLRILKSSRNLTMLKDPKRFSINYTDSDRGLQTDLKAFFKSPGKPLEPIIRSTMESRFGHNFSQIRVHSDAFAFNVADDIGARAFTVGNELGFAARQYSPETTEGKKLLAHELTHSIQQGCVAPSPIYNGESTRKKSISRSLRPMIQTKLIVNPKDTIPRVRGQATAKAFTDVMQRLINQTCPAGSFQVNTATGNVEPKDRNFCHWPLATFKHPPYPYTPVGCSCLCDAINHIRTTTISFHAGKHNTQIEMDFVSLEGPGHLGVQADPTVNIDPRKKMQYQINGKWVDMPFYIVLAHELCGHAMNLMYGTHPVTGPTPQGGTPRHERNAVDVERAIAAEHGLPKRPEDYAGAARIIR